MTDNGLMSSVLDQVETAPSKTEANKRLKAGAALLGATEAALRAALEARKAQEAAEEAKVEAAAKLPKQTLNKTFRSILDALPEGTFLSYKDGHLYVAQEATIKVSQGLFKVYTFGGTPLLREGEHIGCGSASGSKVPYRLGHLLKEGGVEESKAGAVEPALRSDIEALSPEARAACSWAMDLGARPGAMSAFYADNGMTFVSGRRVKTPEAQKYDPCKSIQMLARDLPTGHASKAPLASVVALMGGKED